jgi:two-component system, chemotaxis family, CheB/CheR fusion protein
VTNLLDNAAKFTSSGGSIHVRLAREQGEAVLNVRDTGIGIAAEMLPRIFEAFVQADSSLDRRYGGLGIGLMVAKTLVEMHGGRIDVRSAGVGAGAEFVVRLPLALDVPAAAPMATPPSPRTTTPSPGVARRVAVVEDNEDAREALSAALGIHGHETIPVADAGTAVAVCRDERADVFIIDIGLPGMNGYDLARTLRRLPRGHSALLIALSGYGTEEDKSEAIRAGFDVHLTKPAPVEQIEELLRARR